MQRTTAAAAEGNEKAERKISSLNNTETKENTCCFLDDRCRDVRRRAEVGNTDAEIKKEKRRTDRWSPLSLALPSCLVPWLV